MDTWCSSPSTLDTLVPLQPTLGTRFLSCNDSNSPVAFSNHLDTQDTQTALGSPPSETGSLGPNSRIQKNLLVDAALSFLISKGRWAQCPRETMASEGDFDIGSLSASQQEALQQYTDVTSQEVKDAIPILERSQWNVQVCTPCAVSGPQS